MNITRVLSPALFASAMLLACGHSGAEVWDHALLSTVELPDASHNCIFFKLQNVPQADGAFPNNPWMAIPATQVGFAQMYDVLVRQKSGGRFTLGVVTSGAAAPGCASANFSEIVGVTYIYLD